MKDTRNATSSIGQDSTEERGTDMRTASTANDAGRSSSLRTKVISVAATGALALALFVGATVFHGPAVFAETSEDLVPQTPDQDVETCDNAGGDPEMEFDDSGNAVGVDCTFADGSGWACGDSGDGLGYGCISWGEDATRDLGDAPELQIPPLEIAPVDPPEPPDLGTGDSPQDGDVFVDPPEPADEADESDNEPPSDQPDTATDDPTEPTEEPPVDQAGTSVTIDESGASQADNAASAGSDQASSISLMVVALAVALGLALIGAFAVIRRKMRA